MLLYVKDALSGEANEMQAKLGAVTRPSEARERAVLWQSVTTTPPTTSVSLWGGAQNITRGGGWVGCSCTQFRYSF